MFASDCGSIDVYHEGTKTHEDHKNYLVQERFVSFVGPSCLREESDPRSCLVAAAPLELILIVCEEHVEAGERSVTAADIALQFHLHLVGQLGRVHMLLEGA